jgi:hypothetical protein
VTARISSRNGDQPNIQAHAKSRSVQVGVAIGRTDGAGAAAAIRPKRCDHMYN